MRPKYEQLAAELRREIQMGQYTAAGRLPAEAVLSKQRQVCRQTVRRALELLAAEGLIDRRHGSSSYLKQSPQRQRRVAVVLSYPSDYIFPRVLDDIQNVLYANSFTPMLFSTGNRTGRERAVLERLLQEDLSGLLMEGVRTALPNPNLDLYRQLRQRGVPSVFLYAPPNGLEGAVCISDDDRGGGYLLTRYLIGLGHDRIGGIFKADDRQGTERYLGYAEALRDAGITLDESCLRWFNSEDRLDLLNTGNPWFLHRYLERYLGGCSAVLCYNDEIAYQLIRLLLSAGQRVPEDVSVVSFDHSYYSDNSPIPITSLTHSAQQPGRLATEELVSMMSGRPGQSRTLSWTLVKRDSSGPRPGRRF